MEQCVDIGKKGEDLAIIFLENKHFTILHRNWRYRRWELDIIAVKDDVIHFVEVKTRTSLLYGFPELKITPQKMQRLLNAAEEFLWLNPYWKRVQFDGLSILIQNDKTEYLFIEDIYL